MNRDKLMAVLVIFFMLSGAFGLLQNYHPQTVNSSNNSSNHSVFSQISPISETGTAQTTVSYYKTQSVGNSSITTTYMPVVENSSASSTNFNFGVGLNSNNNIANTNYNMGTYYYHGGTSAGLQSLIIPAIRVSGLLNGHPDAVYSVGTVYVNITGANLSIHSSYTVDATNLIGTDKAYILYQVSPASISASSGGVLTITVAETNVGSGGLSSASYSLSFSSVYTYATTASGDSINVVSTLPSQSAVSFTTGWHYQPISVSFSIPQYESSFTIYWNSHGTQLAPNNAPYMCASYNGKNYLSQDTFMSGTLTSNTFIMNPVGDPLPFGIFNNYYFKWYLTSQQQVITASTTESSSPAYTYSQVSGTANEASALYNFSATTPSSAVFINYETSTNSLKTTPTTITFAQIITVTNPYSTCVQNELTVSVTGSSVGSFSSANSLNPSFNIPSATYTSSATPLWHVSLQAYGNTAPTYVNSNVIFSSSSNMAKLYFNATQPVFSGEQVNISVNWGDSHTQTFSSTTNYNFAEKHSYSQTGTYTITVTLSNLPNPTNNYLSSISLTPIALTYKISIAVSGITPTPSSSLASGSSITFNFHSTNNLVNTVWVNETQAGTTVNVNTITYATPTASDKITVSPSYAGTTFTLTIAFDGVHATYSYLYFSPIYPGNSSSFISVLYSNSATQVYPINLTNTPSGSGYYQQLLNIPNPAKYGINSNGSNLQFTALNNTPEYAWIQSVNSTNLVVWVKNFNQSTVIEMQVFPEFENLFSANGYLGYGRTYFNAPYVFTYATDFTNLNGWTVYSLGTGSQQIITPNGLNITETNLVSNLTYNPSNSVLYFSQQVNYAQTTNSYEHKTGFYNGNNNIPFESTYMLNDGTTDWLTQNDTASSLIGIHNINITKFNLYSIWTNQTEAFYNVNGITTINSVDFTLDTTSNVMIRSASPNDTYLTSYVLIASSISNTIDMPTFTTSSQIMFTYHIQVKSFNNQNTIKNCFKYNNNVYNSITNTFIFSNSSKFIFSILPQNYTILNTSYLTNTSIINIKQNQYTSANFINYYYNISISYFSKTSTPINYYSPPNYYFTIGIIIFLLIGGLIIYTKIRNGD